VPAICFSLVLYKHSIESLSPLLSSIRLLADHAPWLRILLCVYDGSPLGHPSPSKEELMRDLPSLDILYSRGKNVGFGSANNINFIRAPLAPFDVFAVVNPDIRFSPEQLLPLLYWAFSSTDYACVAPLILLESGAIQYSVKHDPTVLSLLLGRFECLKRFNLLRKYDSWHKNLGCDYSSAVIPSTYMSGCFLLIPAWAYDRVGGFCEKYFLHVEDADIVRRLSTVGSCLHNPIGVVVHGWARGSHSSLSQILSLLKSFLLYSWIWGFRLL
jgi:GT2 family glycosyltransferase